MIDRHARDLAAEALQELLNGSISNYQYEDRYPESEDDRALRAIFNIVWYRYSDLRQHKLAGKYSLSESNRALIGRCVLFLKGDLEYRWAVPEPRFRYGIMRLLGFGKILDKRIQQQCSGGEDEAWPFFTKRDHAEALTGKEPGAN